MMMMMMAMKVMMLFSRPLSPAVRLICAWKTAGHVTRPSSHHSEPSGLCWPEVNPLPVLASFLLSSSLLNASRSTRKEKRVKILEHVLKTHKVLILLKTCCQWSANTSSVRIVSHLKLHLSQKRWFTQINHECCSVLNNLGILSPFLNVLQWIIFFQWTDPHGNRWCAFATENTLFTCEQKDRKPKTEQLYIEKQNKTWKWDLNRQKALNLGCCVQSHLVLKTLKKPKTLCTSRLFHKFFDDSHWSLSKWEEFILKKMSSGH